MQFSPRGTVLARERGGAVVRKNGDDFVIFACRQLAAAPLLVGGCLDLGIVLTDTGLDKHARHDA